MTFIVLPGIVGGQSQVADWLWNEDDAALLITNHVLLTSDVGLELDSLPPDRNVALGEVAKNDLVSECP